MVAPVHNLDLTMLLEGSAKLRWAVGGAQRPVGRGNESKKTGARSARARTRGQNPLVVAIPRYKIDLAAEALGDCSYTEIQG